MLVKPKGFNFLLILSISFLKAVICITTDNFVLSNITGLKLLQALRHFSIFFLLPTIFILNNQYMGMVRQWQELLHEKNYSESYSEALPDFVKLAEAYGCKGIMAQNPSELDDKIKEMVDHNGPVIFDCQVDPNENCFPMIPSGKPHNQMILGPNDKEDNKITGKGKALV